MASHSIRTEAIVAAALEIAEERGVAGITTGALARRFNFTEAALYRYFPGKAAIVASALQHLGERVFATMLIELMPDAAGHGQTIEAQLEGHIRRFASRQGLLLELLVAAAAGRDREVQEAGDAFLREYATRMDGYFSQVQKRTLIAATPSGVELERLWICQLLGGFVRCRLTREPWDPTTQSGFEAFLGQLRSHSRSAERQEAKLEPTGP
ncbi:MAG: TetR/AcrR family transcriptional regulator [Thermoanaerobaculales bacterium]